MFIWVTNDKKTATIKLIKQVTNNQLIVKLYINNTENNKTKLIKRLVLNQTSKGICGLELDYSKVLYALGSRTKYLKRVFCNF